MGGGGGGNWFKANFSLLYRHVTAIVAFALSVSPWLNVSITMTTSWQERSNYKELMGKDRRRPEGQHGEDSRTENWQKWGWEKFWHHETSLKIAQRLLQVSISSLSTRLQADVTKFLSLMLSLYRFKCTANTFSLGNRGPATEVIKEKLADYCSCISVPLFVFLLDKIVLN